MTSFYSTEELQKLGIRSYGENIFISRKCSLYGADKMVFANNVRIDDFCILSGDIMIGNYVHIAAGTMLFSGNYRIIFEDFTTISSRSAVYAASDYYDGESLTYPMLSSECRKTYGGDVLIKRHSIIGTGTTILPNVIIGVGCSIGAMSLVNKSLSEWTVYAGIPAKRIRDNSRKVLELEKLLSHR
ncbi:MAG: acyltransferase [Bacteroidales bacterium]|jgi:galactoside O-acetyltransferase|nr:acyltransferase [Bacteroidales bacterium]